MESSKKEEGRDDGKMPAVVNPYKRRKRDEHHCAPKRSSSWPFEEDDVPFEEDLITYLESYRYLERQSWCTASSNPPKGGGLSDKQMSWLELIRQYDYSNAHVVLIPSVPGRHREGDYHNFGYLKLRKAIVEWVRPRLQNDEQPSTTPPPPILCQFSSIGSLNEKWLDQFLSAIDYSSARDVDPIGKSRRDEKKGTKDTRPSLSSRMKIIWPTMDEIRTSIEGYQGGGSVPGRVKNLSKAFLEPLFHRWSRRNGSDSKGSSDPFKTARHVPHIKTFVQPSSSVDGGIEWLALTSHNLSMAAWGQLQKPSDQSRADERVLFIRHWELGVFMSPATLAMRAAPDDDAAGGDEAVSIFPFPCNNASRDSNAVITIDGDDDDEEDDENEAPRVLVPIPFAMDPDRYDGNDVPWACDRSCLVPDAFGCIMP